MKSKSSVEDSAIEKGKITEEIIKKAQEGSSEAFAVIYNETVKTAYYVAKRILISEEATEDVLQEAYIAVFRNLSKYQTGNFQGWVDTIVANRAKNYLRKKNPILFSEMETEERPVVEFEEEKIEFRPDEKVEYDETKRLVLEIIDNLSPEQRLSVILFYFENRSVKEIAEICECSENTVKSRLNYARKKIKEDVLELEKKGTKLYGISIMPFIMWMLTENAKAAEISGDVAAKVLASVGSVGAVEATAGVVAGGTGAAVAGATASSAVASVVSTTAVSVTTKVGMTLGAKIAIGAAAVAITAGAVVGGIAMNNNDVPKEDVKVTLAPYNEVNDNKSDTDDMQDENTESVTEDTDEKKEFGIIKTKTKQDGDDKEYYEYDKAGNEIKYIMTDESTGDISSHIESIYDENGNILKKTDLLNSQFTTEFVYDKYGNCIIELSQSQVPNIHTYEISYDESAKKAYVDYKDEGGAVCNRDEWSYYEDGTAKQQIYTDDEGGKCIIDYNEKGKEVKCTAYMDDGTVGHIIERGYDDNGNMLFDKYLDDNGNCYMETIYVYDATGNLLKEQNFDSGSVSSTIEYTYNEDGRLEKIIGYQGESVYDYEVVYEYDENNNVIRECRQDEVGVVTEVQYIYTYY